MKVFISWSGDRSRRYAEILRDWLPSVIQSVKPYFTPSDIDRGARWSSDVAEQLGSSQIGIFCLTPDNLSAPWLLFEAGAISNAVGQAHVCPLLFGVSTTDVQDPLSQFQLTNWNRSEFLGLLQTVNRQLGDSTLAEPVLERTFDRAWPEIDSSVGAILEEPASDSPKSDRTDRDLLEEILAIARSLSREQEMSRSAFEQFAGRRSRRTGDPAVEELVVRVRDRIAREKHSSKHKPSSLEERLLSLIEQVPPSEEDPSV